jgi:hypothetical protein
MEASNNARLPPLLLLEPQLLLLLNCNEKVSAESARRMDDCNEAQFLTELPSQVL